MLPTSSRDIDDNSKKRRKDKSALMTMLTRGPAMLADPACLLPTLVVLCLLGLLFHHNTSKEMDQQMLAGDAENLEKFNERFKFAETHRDVDGEKEMPTIMVRSRADAVVEPRPPNPSTCRGVSPRPKQTL
jgi:hypothetical protein